MMLLVSVQIKKQEMSVKGQPAHYAQLYMQEYSKQSAQMSGLSLFRNITGRH